jgi:tetratricopeptide (TPR) repeat protein
VQNTLGEAVLCQVDALLCTHRREHGQAEALARKAVELIERTDGLNYQGDAFCALAAALSAAGKEEQALAALVEALDRYERKNNVAMANQTRARLHGKPA